MLSNIYMRMVLVSTAILYGLRTSLKKINYDLFGRLVKLRFVNTKFFFFFLNLAL